MRTERILVLMGGKSSEREISLRSGRAVTDALREAGFDAQALDLNRESIEKICQIRPDVAFIALHGKGGEDGAVQGLLEWLEIPYTGPDIRASAICMDKITTKKLLAANGLATPKFLILEKEAMATKVAAAKLVCDTLGLPVVLKSPSQGSSIGVVIAREEGELAPAIEELFSLGDQVLAEAYLRGTELTVPVLGNRDPSVLPIIEITSEGQFYDYRSKYTPGKSQHIIPARIDDKTREKVKDLARRAYLATGCRGYARVDLMLDENGDPQILEINTAPGMTATSLFPDAARAAGLSFPKLVEKMVDLALENR